MLQRYAWLGLLSLALSLPPAASGLASASAPAYLADELIVKLRPGLALSQGAQVLAPGATSLGVELRAFGAHVATPIAAGSDTYLVRLSGADVPSAARALASDPAVAFAQPNYLRQVLKTPNDSVFEQQWALRNMQLPAAWDITTGGELVVAVIDTGVAADHPDLSGKLLPGYDFFNNDNDASDDNGHGTATSGLIAANSDNGQGIAGICWGCRILPVKVLGSRGQGGDASVAAGIRFATDNGARIINMSLGGSEDSPVLREAVEYAQQRGALIVAATGNEAAEGNPVNYPAAYDGVLSVTATGNTDVVTGFSNYGNYVDLSAPGVGVWSTLWTSGGNTYGPANGTSFAAPHVAGIAALVWSLRPDLGASQVANVLMASADDKGEPGKDPYYGYGRVNALRAVQLAADPAVLTSSRIQGQVSGVDPSQVVLTLNTGQQTQPDASGYYAFEGLGPGLYVVTASGALNETQQVFVDGTVLSVATLNFGGNPAARAAFQPAQPRAGAQFFAETQHNLGGAFLAYWQRHGGLPVFGFPISEEFVEKGEDGREYTVQYFERHRFEYHPENAAPYDVLLGRMGDVILLQQGRSWFTFPKGEARGGCLSFDTGHVLCEPFLSYWRGQGLEIDGRPGFSVEENLALFGQPLSEPQQEEVAPGVFLSVQWFERARFEDHGQNGVLLGLLGNELAARRGLR
jgi:type VII secretion-associated serine protease mycosin